MKPVGQEEADRRATFNEQKAEEVTKAEPGSSAVAPPVITQEIDMSQAGPAHDKPPTGIALPEIKPVPKTEIKIPERVVAPVDPVREQEARDLAAAEAERRRIQTDRHNSVAQRVQGQIDQLLANTGQPTINIQNYKEPPKPEPKTASNTSRAGTGTGAGGPRVGQASGPMILAAKPGDVFYASLKVGFNSDDPRGLPVFATVYDQRANGSYGPLHGGVLAGNVTYSQDQAAVTFTQMTLRDGRTAPVQAMAATLKDVRPGVATTVDRHTLSRYSGLVVASLIQGLGTAGQQLLDNDTTTTVADGVVTISGRDKIDWAKVGMATVQPLGQNLSQAFAQRFNRPATIASPAGTDVGIVFLQQVTVEAQR